MCLQAWHFAITCTFSDAFCAVLQLCLPYGSIDWPDMLIKASFPPPNAPWYPQGVPLQKGHKKMPKKKKDHKKKSKKKHTLLLPICSSLNRCLTISVLLPHFSHHSPDENHMLPHAAAFFHESLTFCMCQAYTLRPSTPRQNPSLDLNSMHNGVSCTVRRQPCLMQDLKLPLCDGMLRRSSTNGCVSFFPLWRST